MIASEVARKSCNICNFQLFAIRRSAAASSAPHISDPIYNSISHLCHLLTPTASSAQLCQAAADTQQPLFPESSSQNHQPRWWTRHWSEGDGKCTTLNPVFSSFKVSTCLWLEPPLQGKKSSMISVMVKLPLQMSSSAFSLRFHRKTRSSSRRKEVHKLQGASDPLLCASLTRQLFGTSPRRTDIYRKIKVLIEVSSGKSHVWHFHRVFTLHSPSPESGDPKKGKRNNLKYNREPQFALKALLMNY